MSPNRFKKISHPDLEISLYLSNFGKEVSQLTDWQTYKKFPDLFGTSVQTSQESLQKNSERFIIQNQRYLYISSKPTNRLTDIQEIQHYLGLASQHIINVSKNCRKISLSELEKSLYSSNFSKEVTQPRNVSKKFQKDISSRTKDIKQFS